MSPCSFKERSVKDGGPDTAACGNDQMQVIRFEL